MRSGWHDSPRAVWVSCAQRGTSAYASPRSGAALARAHTARVDFGRCRGPVDGARRWRPARTSRGCARASRLRTHGLACGPARAATLWPRMRLRLRPLDAAPALRRRAADRPSIHARRSRALAAGSCMLRWPATARATLVSYACRQAARRWKARFAVRADRVPFVEALTRNLRWTHASGRTVSQRSGHHLCVTLREQEVEDACTFFSRVTFPTSRPSLLPQTVYLTSQSLAHAAPLADHRRRPVSAAASATKPFARDSFATVATPTTRWPAHNVRYCTSRRDAPVLGEQYRGARPPTHIRTLYTAQRVARCTPA